MAATQPYRAPKAPARAFAGHLILSCGVGVFSHGYILFKVQRRQKAKAKAKAQAEGACLPCFSLSWNASSSFGPEKWVWFGVRGGWPPQYMTWTTTLNGSFMHKRAWLHYVVTSAGRSSRDGRMETNSEETLLF